MKKRILAACLLFLACPVLAEEEVVTVQKNGPVGIWKFSVPQGFSFSFLHKSKWEPNADVFCQIEESDTKLTVHCLGLRLGSKDVSHGVVALKGSHIRMTWGSMALSFTIDGALQNADEFGGTAFVRVLGVSDDAPNKVTGTRLVLSENATDKGGKSLLLTRTLDAMAKGVFPAPQDASAKNVRILKPDTLRALGAVQALIYLGDTGQGSASGQNSVYDIEFANGHLICALHLSGGVRLDYFECG